MNETQNDAPFVTFYDMHAVTFVPPDEMADVTIAGLQWFTLILRLNHTGSHRPIDSHSIPYKLQGKQPFVADFSHLLRHAIKKGRGPILYIKNTPGPHRETTKVPNKPKISVKSNLMGECSTILRAYTLNRRLG